ncbi:DUF4376 domain-containing protein [Novosphingobium sp.]|jgi:hypothetical protein|uniref:DUF4376 domain-containing protein n=1 Tax=Novosphingobium sp. TaxID=1874826 RepID=UPI002FE0668C
MFAYILHSVDCAEQVQFLEMTSGYLPPPPEGYLWTECPTPATSYRISVADGQYHAIEYVEDPAVQLATAKRTKLDEVNSYRSCRASVASTSFGLVEADETSRTNFNGAVSMARLSQEAGRPFSITWRMFDNSEQVLDAEQIIALGLEVAGYVNACYERSFALKNTIEAVLSLEDLAAVDITAGWPGSPTTGGDEAAKKGN